MDALVPFLPTIVAGFSSTLIPLFYFYFNRDHLIRLGEIQIGSWRPFSPNGLTILGTVLVLTGAAIYAFGSHPIGVAVAGFGGICDKLDGWSARAFKRTLPTRFILRVRRTFYMRGRDHTPITYSVTVCRKLARLMFEINFLGATRLGKVLDPFVDKVKCLVLMAGFGYEGLLSVPLIIMLAVPEFIGTILRWPFSFLEKHQNDGSSTWVGKTKAIMEWIVIIACIPFHEGWPVVTHASDDLRSGILNGLLIMCIPLAILSPATRFPGFRKVFETFLPVGSVPVSK